MRTGAHTGFPARAMICRPAIRVCAFIALNLCVFSGCREQPSDSRKEEPGFPADTFDVAFYNVENLFDDEFDGTEFLEYRPGATNWDQQMHAKKFDNIASVLSAMNASIVALCEVEDRDALRQLQKALRQKGCVYTHAAICDLPVRSATRPAVLSRFPIIRQSSVPAEPYDSTAFRRTLETDIGINGRILKLFVNHWPSKKHPESFRMKFAEALSRRIASLDSTVDYLLLGDFNSNYDEFSTFSTCGHDDTRGRTGINHVLHTVKRISPRTERCLMEREVIASPVRAHYDLWLELPETIRMSYFFGGNNQTPDHLLLPPSLYDSMGISYADNSFSAFTWGSRLISRGVPIRWKVNYRQNGKYHAGEGYSDHLPIVARFTTKPFSLAPGDRSVTAALPGNGEEGWFEYHTNGWVACNRRVQYGRDPLNSREGTYSLHVAAPPLGKNSSVIRAVIGREWLSKNGTLTMFIKGSGSVCFRSRIPGGRWRYHSSVDGRASGKATYSPVKYFEWRRISLPVAIPGREVEIELRTASTTPLDLWIDR